MLACDQRQHRISRRSLVPLRQINGQYGSTLTVRGKARVHDELGFREGARKPVSTAQALDEALHSL